MMTKNWVNIDLGIGLLPLYQAITWTNDFNKSTLVQVRVQYQTGDKTVPEPMVTLLTWHIQWKPFIARFIIVNIL